MSTFFRLDSFWGAPKVPLILCADQLRQKGEGADAAALQAITDYVRRIQSEAYVRTDELPDPALNLCELSRYIDQVSNGGHTQYFYNTRTTFKQSWACVKAALHMVRAKPFQPIARAFDALAAQALNDPSVDCTDFNALRPYFEPLDAPYFKQSDAKPLTSFAAQKIRRLPGAKKLPAAELDAAFQLAAAQNPFLSSRRDAMRISAQYGRLIDPNFIGFAMALIRLPQPDVFGGAYGGSLTQLDGRDCPVFPLTSLEGGKCAIVTPDQIHIHEKAPGPLRERSEDAAALMPHADAGAGTHLLSLPAQEVQLVADHAKSRQLPIVASELLQKVGVDAPVAHFACVATPETVAQDSSRWWLLLEGRMFVLALDADGATLEDPEHAADLARVSLLDIEKRAEDLKD